MLSISYCIGIAVTIGNVGNLFITSINAVIFGNLNIANLKLVFIKVWQIIINCISTTSKANFVSGNTSSAFSCLVTAISKLQAINTIDGFAVGVRGCLVKG